MRAVCFGECSDDLETTAVFIVRAGGSPGASMHGWTTVAHSDPYPIVAILAEVEHNRREGMLNGVGDQFGHDQYHCLDAIPTHLPVLQQPLRGAASNCHSVGTVFENLMYTVTVTDFSCHT